MDDLGSFRGDGHTVLRGELLPADHKACHLAQLVTVRRASGAMPKELTASAGDDT